jgi:hypothetical protein
MGEVFLNHSIRWRSGQAFPYFTKWRWPVLGQDLEQLPLSLGEVMRYAMRGNVATGQEPDPNAAGLLAELGLRVPCLDA